MDTILIVDDEEEILSLLKVYLENENYKVVAFENATNALDYLENQEVDLAILDVMLPDMNGFTLCHKIREKKFYPIIMLTAKNAEEDLLNGLTMGADDYITKPFKPIEVIARVKTQLRRYKKYNPTDHDNPDSDIIDIRGLFMNGTTHEARLFETDLDLTPIEFSILYYLCRHQGKVISSEELFEKIWGDKYMDSNNTIMTHIGRLREKMHENARKPKFVKTVWGVGYKVE